MVFRYEMLLFLCYFVFSMKNTQKIEIKRYTDAFKKEWDAFVDEAKNSTFLFRRDFMEYHKDRFEDFSLLVFQGRKLIALFPANAVLENIYSHQGLSYGGFLVKKSVTFERYIEIVQAVLKFYNTLGYLYIHIKALPDFYDSQPSQELDYILFLLNAALVRKDAYYMMPTATFCLNRNRKRALLKAERYNFYVERNNDFGTFWNTLLIPNLKKRFKTEPVHTKEEMLHLHQFFPDNICFFGLYEGKEMRAGAVMFISDKVAHFQYSSGDEERHTGALDVLFNYIIKFYKDKKHISFGNSSEEGGRVLNKGLALWKESFGAQMTTQGFYRIETKNEMLLKNILR